MKRLSIARSSVLVLAAGCSSSSSTPSTTTAGTTTTRFTATLSPAQENAADRERGSGRQRYGRRWTFNITT